MSRFWAFWGVFLIASLIAIVYHENNAVRDDLDSLRHYLEIACLVICVVFIVKQLEQVKKQRGGQGE